MWITPLVHHHTVTIIFGGWRIGFGLHFGGSSSSRYRADRRRLSYKIPFLSYATNLRLCHRRAEKCKLPSDFKSFVQWSQEEATYRDFWLYQLRAREGKMLNDVRLIFLPCPLQFGGTQNQLDFGVGYFPWLMLREYTVNFSYSYRQIRMFRSIAVQFVLLLCHLQTFY